MTSWISQVSSLQNESQTQKGEDKSAHINKSDQAKSELLSWLEVKVPTSGKKWAVDALNQEVKSELLAQSLG